MQAYMSYGVLSGSPKEVEDIVQCNCGLFSWIHFDVKIVLILELMAMVKHAKSHIYTLG